jgi:magnesium-transporting ATPase (P-type)
MLSTANCVTLVPVMRSELVLEGPAFRRRVLAEDGSIRQAAFDELWPTLRVLARCSPADKYTIVKGAGNCRTSDCTRKQDPAATAGY